MPVKHRVMTYILHQDCTNSLLLGMPVKITNALLQSIQKMFAKVVRRSKYNVQLDHVWY